ncbi:nuclear transport factor 2 family protein [Sphingomonas naphthae]|uniref:Nuclear transport factor 2 family protein n=1 Tax=Sphingomonas naphthae TaxID=1813468 RepID=A0ABY7TPL1_9SPHN|nr:nuclear transport factor 2 family protein [Sphingomonas naphthae]WCT75172.1 nuclear transport factor 2 family protein [Sphingomonas naphthae]
MDEALAARMQALLDRQDILDCLTRMSRATDRADRDLFLSAFHADAIIAAGPFVGSPVELFDWASALQEQAHSATFHNILNHHCEIEGDTAHGETYYLYAAANRDQTNILAGGRYLDRFEKRDGQWKLLVRNNLIEWSSIVPALDNPLNALPDIHANGIAARSREDASYLRPLRNVRSRNVPQV